MVVVIVLLVWISSIFVAQAIGSKKGRSFSWVWGLLLGWVGVLVVALQSPEASEASVVPAPIPVAPGSPLVSVPLVEVEALKKCPDCAESVQPEAKVCRFCGYRFAGPADSAATT